MLDQNGKVVRLAPNDIAKQPEHDGDFDYAGVDDNYFMTVALVHRAEQGHLSAGVDSAAGRLEGAAARAGVVRDRAGAAPTRRLASSSARRTSTCSARSIRNSRCAINFGMFTVIVVPLLRSLKWVNGFVGNYGWSIIILTIIINVDHASRCGTRAWCRCGRCRRFSRR